MIDNAQTLGDDISSLEAPFQAQMLQHWREILNNRRIPHKRDFRPQNFPKFLPQLAIVSLTPDDGFEDRLTGSSVATMLQLGDHAMLRAARSEQVRALVDDLLGRASKTAEPMYFKGSVAPTDLVTVDFTALVLPFSHADEGETADTLLLAFDFTRTPAVNGIKVKGAGK